MARKAWFVDATEIALSFSSPIFINIIMVGALAGGTHLIPLERKAFEEIIEGGFSGVYLEDNLQAFAKGFESIR